MEIKAKMSSYLKVWQTKNVTTIETKIMADFSRRFLKYDLEVAERESQYAVDLMKWENYLKCFKSRGP